MKKKAIIISIKALKLSPKEKLLLSKEKPWGLILFKRNILSFYQIKKLVNFFKVFGSRFCHGLNDSGGF